ncbi:hypothetical protein J5295_08785 [Riemerella anatipestifer]|uniref:Uncharacterized protein n=2 Tax=Riemerella anatipestifer TaxID=34085 RepID=E4TDZ3_RIEAD|nr:hypothetical protein [Riemerella anatipestifer]ADQ83002.1 hypothetical protein Riean_1849 [Riemerella anatipestifer ATCC 11845 = DSM 15868]AFD55072.1 hypothetical protein RA0C_0049 [Riemerella anatipestifer ATCC 11845 = DSM 15868]AGC41009.1 hypothetical protein G148_1705 [Riemerella anatipestifer RA-CH-2]AKP70168.1 hypothetical protein CG08_2093 [Riemerella anatipestifer]AKQ40616.1 hypothetical protein AS87_09980 [Riemerella anatipestifer Yb2]
MKLIVLERDSNTGKTTTIGLLYEKLLNNGGASTNKQPLGGGPNDFSDIVINYKSLKIAIFTMGDYSTAISKAIVHYDNLGCDFFICSLSKGKYKVRANNQINNYPNIKIQKTISSQSISEIQANDNDAYQIFSMI